MAIKGTKNNEEVTRSNGLEAVVVTVTGTTCRIYVVSLVRAGKG